MRSRGWGSPHSPLKTGVLKGADFCEIAQNRCAAAHAKTPRFSYFDSPKYDPSFHQVPTRTPLEPPGSIHQTDPTPAREGCTLRPNPSRKCDSKGRGGPILHLKPVCPKVAFFAKSRKTSVPLPMQKRPDSAVLIVPNMTHNLIRCRLASSRNPPQIHPTSRSHTRPGGVHTATKPIPKMRFKG